jgi:molecular chaperone GrpE
MTKKNDYNLNDNENPQGDITSEEVGSEEAGAPTPSDAPVPEAEVVDFLSEEDSLQKELMAARDESRQNHERYLRAVADWENYRRRVAREKDELRQHVVSGLVEEFLPVLDNLDLGLQTAANHPEAANVAKGFQMVADQIRGILEQNGVTSIDPTGEAFDPHQHESLSQQPHPDVPEGHVVQVIRKGYKLNTRLLRPASVVVSSGPLAAGDES